MYRYRKYTVQTNMYVCTQEDTGTVSLRQRWTLNTGEACRMLNRHGAIMYHAHAYLRQMRNYAHLPSFTISDLFASILRKIANSKCLIYMGDLLLIKGDHSFLFEI